MKKHRHCLKDLNGFHDFIQRHNDQDAPWLLRIEQLERQLSNQQALLNNLLTRIDRLEINRGC